MANHVDAVISGVISGIPILIALFLERYFVYLSERKHVDKEFIRIKRHIYSLFEETHEVGEWFKSFRELKHFFDRNYEYLEIQENDRFCERWLKQPSVDATLTDASYWYKEKKLNDADVREEIIEELDDTKSPKRSWMFW